MNIKKSLYLVLLVFFAASFVQAQTPNGIMTTSNAVVHSHSETGLPIAPFSSTSYYSNIGAIRAGDMRARDYYACCGSKYSSNITEVGTPLFKNPDDELIRRRRVDVNPEIPFPDPVGEIPFVLMAVLAGVYIAWRKWRKMREQKRSICAANN